MVGSLGLRLVFVCLLGSSAWALSPDPAALPASPGLGDTYTERETGVRFLRASVPPGGGDEQLIAGAGVRTKFFFKVYAVALHVEPLPAWDELEDWRRKDSEALEDDDDFFTDLMSDAVPKTLTLVMVRDVDAEDMREAFEDALEPRVRKTRDKAQRAQGLQALATFEGWFDKEYVKGTTMELAAQPGGRLNVWVDGLRKGELVSPPLVDALFDVYLGEDPISDDARDAFGRGMAKVFERGRELADERAQAEAEREAGGDHDEGAGEGDDERASARAERERQRLAEERIERGTAQLHRQGANQGEKLVALLIEATGLLDALESVGDPLAERARAVHEAARAFAESEGLASWIGVDELPPPPCLCAFDDAEGEWLELRAWMRRVHGRLLEHARLQEVAS